MKFGISFTLTHLNQAGALVHVYQDGSVHLNHGGTEMGQGLFQKVAQVAAEEFGIGLERVHITATSTDKVPNTSATAASSGTDLNGMAVQHAAREIKDAADAVRQRDLERRRGSHHVPRRPRLHRQREHSVRRIDQEGLRRRACICRRPASTRRRSCIGIATRAKGRPFFYFAYGAACSEVAIDILSGEMKVRRVDILHDVGRSINPAIDIGQIEGAFVQGMGWLTTEELVYDEKGRLLTHAPSTYKIPVASDVPADFRVALVRRQQSRGHDLPLEGGRRAAADAGISVFAAIADAIHSAQSGQAGRARRARDAGSDHSRRSARSMPWPRSAPLESWRMMFDGSSTASGGIR